MGKFLTNLAGLTFRPADAKEIVKQLRPGQRLGLEREPQNAYDENAIKIWVPNLEDGGFGPDATFIGYVEKLANGPIALDLDVDGRYAAFIKTSYDDYEEPIKTGLWGRPLIEIFTKDDALIEERRLSDATTTP